MVILKILLPIRDRIGRLVRNGGTGFQPIGVKLTFRPGSSRRDEKTIAQRFIAGKVARETCSPSRDD